MGDLVDGADPLLAEGTRVGDFQIRGFLGEGAMGQVYLAQDVTLGRRVALKFIKHSVMQGNGIERFLEEARTTASFNHPHIVTLHVVGQHEGRPYLALEYLDGDSLRARLAAGPLPVREALRYCRAVAEAIAEAHSRGLVHADLKPENIVIPRDGRVRVVDFGVSKLVGGAAIAASGTPAYMAPERWHGVPPTGAIDIWALGLMLHELIVGRHPIPDAKLLHLAFAVDALELPGLPAEPWAQLVRDCLQLDPAARPSADEVIRRLDRILDPDNATEEIAHEAILRAAGSGDEITLPTADEDKLVRGILLVLAAPDESRRLRHRGALIESVPIGSREVVARLVDRLVARRVLVATRDDERGDVMLEVAHDVLAAAWPQVARWLHEAYAPQPPVARAMPAGTSSGLAVRPPALTDRERRLLSVVLLGGARASDELSPATRVATEALRAAVKPYGGRVSRLDDGATIVVLGAEGQVATDLAAQAARCALALCAIPEVRSLAIAMGRADSTSELPEAEAIERAARLRAQVAAAPAAAVDTPAIALDEMSAGLLDARFDVIEGEAGLMLRGERVLLQGARTLLGRPTSCVGRDWELGTLTGSLDECIDEGGARVMIVTAAAGMGKSRLAAELVGRVQQRGDQVAIWLARGDSLRAGSTLGLLAQALRGALGIRDGAPPSERRDQIRTRVAERVPAGAQRRVAEFLGEIVGAPFPDDEASAALKAARQDAQLMSEQMHQAWLELLKAEASARPVLLVLDDLHWGDFGTVQFIDMALRERSELPWMVLALARPEVFELFPRLWAERQNVQEIRLKELGRKAGERLVRQVLGDRVGPETVEQLVRQADGNAFYLEELIRAVAEGRDASLPKTVLAMVETRVARLPVEARRVLRAASVFGEVCWEGGVITLLGGTVTETLVGGTMSTTLAVEWLGRLVEQELLAVRPGGRFPEERELAFRHALLREGAYATLTEKDLRLGHRVAGAWLERHGEGDPMVLAGHFERGGEGARAAGHYLRAAEQAFQVLDLEATVARAGLGLQCAPPEELRLRLLGMHCEASNQGLHLIHVTMPGAEELMRAAPRGSIPWAQAVQTYYSGLLLDGRSAELLPSIAALEDVDLAPEVVGRMSLVILNGIYALDHIGQVPAGTAVEQRFSEIVRQAGDREPFARFWWAVDVGMRAAYAHEDPFRGLVESDAIRPLFDETGSQLMLLNMQLFRGLNLWLLGASVPAERMLEEIPAADQRVGVVSSLRRFILSWLRADRGALEDARALATELRDAGRANHNPLEEARGSWALTEVLRRMGDLDGAERALPAALRLEVPAPLEHPGVLGTLARLRLAQGRPPDALAAAEDALARCTAMGGCGMFRGAFVRLAHAEALDATGAHDAACRAITGARARLHEIAARIPDPAYRRSFLEDVPENARTLALAEAWLAGAPGA